MGKALESNGYRWRLVIDYRLHAELSNYAAFVASIIFLAKETSGNRSDERATLNLNGIYGELNRKNVSRQWKTYL